MLWIRNNFFRIRLRSGFRSASDLFDLKHVFLNFEKEELSNLYPFFKAKRHKILIIYLPFFPDPDLKQIIPNPGKSSASQRILIHSTAWKGMVSESTEHFFNPRTSSVQLWLFKTVHVCCCCVHSIVFRACSNIHLFRIMSRKFCSDECWDHV